MQKMMEQQVEGQLDCWMTPVDKRPLKISEAIEEKA